MSDQVETPEISDNEEAEQQLAYFVIRAEAQADSGDNYRQQAEEAYRDGDTDKAMSLGLMASDAYKEAHDYLRHAAAIAQEDDAIAHYASNADLLNDSHRDAQHSAMRVLAISNGRDAGYHPFTGEATELPEPEDATGSEGDDEEAFDLSQLQD